MTIKVSLYDYLYTYQKSYNLLLLLLTLGSSAHFDQKVCIPDSPGIRISTRIADNPLRFKTGKCHVENQR